MITRAEPAIGPTTKVVWRLRRARRHYARRKDTKPSRSDTRPRRHSFAGAALNAPAGAAWGSRPRAELLAGGPFLHIPQGTAGQGFGHMWRVISAPRRA